MSDKSEKSITIFPHSCENSQSHREFKGIYALSTCSAFKIWHKRDAGGIFVRLSQSYQCLPILIVVHLWEVGVVNKTIDLLFGVLYGSRKKIYDWNQKQEHKTLKDNDRHLFKRAMTWMLLEPCKHLFARFSQRTLSFAINQIYLFFIRMGLIRQSAINFGAVFHRHRVMKYRLTSAISLRVFRGSLELGWLQVLLEYNAS